MTRPHLALFFGLLLPVAVVSCGDSNDAPRLDAASHDAASPKTASPDAASHDMASHDAAAHSTTTHGDAATPAVRWPADAALSRGMQRVRAATQALAAVGNGPGDAGQVQRIAAELRVAVDDMIANCRLEPAPDAALHTLLARVLGAGQTLEDAGDTAEALAELRAVLARYPELFEDAAWIPL